MVAANLYNSGPRVVSKDTLVAENIQRRMKRIENAAKPSKYQDQWLRELADGKIPTAVMPKGFKLEDLKQFQGVPFSEIDTGSVLAQFLTRQEFEVDAGRDEEPILYLPIYDTLRGPFGAQTVDMLTTGPLGVVFEIVPEGGEVKFATLKSSTDSAKIYKYAQGLEYTEEMVRFNKGFMIPELERQFGQAANALLNHAHFGPILTFSYGSANQTAASAVGSDLTEKYHNTIDDAITAARTDVANPRRGPYVLLCASANLSMILKATTQVAQQGFTKQSPAVFNSIQSVIAYDGWTGERGGGVTTYAGVTANKAYLVNLGYRRQDFRSLMEQEFRRQEGDPDSSRFILRQSIWDVWFGVFANPERAVEEITLPTS